MRRDYKKIAEQLAALEKLYASSPSEEGPDGRPLPGEARQFISGVLTAMAHVRREEIDRAHPYGYRPELLQEMHSQQLAKYLCALAMLGHVDEAEAQALLAERGEQELIRLAYAVSDRFGNKDDVA